MGLTPLMGRVETTQAEAESDWHYKGIFAQSWDNIFRDCDTTLFCKQPLKRLIAIVPYSYENMIPTFWLITGLRKVPIYLNVTNF